MRKRCAVRFAKSTANIFLKVVCFGYVDPRRDPLASRRTDGGSVEVCEALMWYRNGCRKRDVEREELRGDGCVSVV